MSLLAGLKFVKKATTVPREDGDEEAEGAGGGRGWGGDGSKRKKKSKKHRKKDNNKRDTTEVSRGRAVRCGAVRKDGKTDERSRYLCAVDDRVFLLLPCCDHGPLAGQLLYYGVVILWIEL